MRRKGCENMYYVETHSVDPCFNLALEEYILKQKTEGDWLILWQNDNTVVVGLNQNPLEEIDQAFVKAHGTRVVRRSTGGGAVYHDLGNLNYSFITDVNEVQTLAMARFTQPVCRALAAMGIQAEVTGRNDITVQGKKVSGIAQRIEGKRILHHGTLLFDEDLDMAAATLRADPAKFQSKSSKSVRSRIGNLRTFLPRDMSLEEFWQRLLAELTRDGLTRVELQPRELEEIKALARRKYESWEWTWGRSPAYTMKNRERWPGGTLEVLLDVKDGQIQQVRFQGDFMATADCDAAQEALRGVRFRREDAAAALDGLDLQVMFGGICKEEILDTIFGSGS